MQQPCYSSEFEKLKHQLTHIPFQPYIILQCDPEPSLINEAESVISKRQERTSAAHHDDHIKATKQSKTVRNSCKDKCARCWLMDSQKTREYNLKGAQKTDAYKMTSAQNVRVDKSKIHVCRPRK